MDPGRPRLTVVFDTMVVAYALLGFTEWHEDSMAALGAAEEVLAPDLLRVELASTLWQYMRHRDLSIDAALEFLTDGELLVDEMVPSSELLADALQLARERDHSPYDTVFIALAVRQGVKLVTYDGPLMGKFPDWTISVERFLSSARG